MIYNLFKIYGNWQLLVIGTNNSNRLLIAYRYCFSRIASFPLLLVELLILVSRQCATYYTYLDPRISYSIAIQINKKNI